MMVLLNLFSASQDISTDSLAVLILEPDELGAGNTVQVVAYKAGSVFAGGLLLWVQDQVGWTGMFYAFGAIYFLTLVLMKSLQLTKRSSEHKVENVKKSDEFNSNQSLWTLFKEIVTVESTVYMINFVLFYKLCERAEQTFSLFMVDKNVPKSQMALWSTIMRTFSLLGSTYGGYALSKHYDCAKHLLSQYCFLRTLPIIGQFAILCYWGPDIVEDTARFSSWNSDSVFMYLGFLCTSLTLFCAGVITTATFTVMMRLSQCSAPEGLQGTHYTTLATFEVLGKLLFASIAGGLIDLLGIKFMYVVFILLGLGCSPLVWAMPKKIADLRSVKST